eukprot:1066375-Pelagomonas_calceolata.AAC.2
MVQVHRNLRFTASDKFVMRSTPIHAVCKANKSTLTMLFVRQLIASSHGPLGTIQEKHEAHLICHGTPSAPH